MNAAKKQVKPRLAVIDGQVTTTSLALAEHFGGKHWAVVKDIFGLECAIEFREKNFALADYADAEGERQPMIRLTRSGFDLWATTFVGSSKKMKAVAEAYRQAFEMMERPRALPTVGMQPAVFRFDGLAVRAFADEKGEPWFLAADVCEVLGYVNPWQAVQKNCREAGVTKREVRCDLSNREVTSTVRETQEMTFINEGNLYRLIIKSRKPEAERFEQLVMDEILPTIRKTGRYEAPSPSQQPGAHPFTNEVAFLRMFYAFDHNLGPAVLLWCLMQMGGTSQWISPTVREIADESGGMISKSNVTRCAVNLMDRGLINMKADLPWSRATYFVLEDVVTTLLQEAGKQLAGLPGIQDEGGPLLLGMMSGTGALMFA